MTEQLCKDCDQIVSCLLAASQAMVNKMEEKLCGKCNQAVEITNICCQKRKSNMSSNSSKQCQAMEVDDDSIVKMSRLLDSKLKPVMDQIDEIRATVQNHVESLAPLKERFEKLKLQDESAGDVSGSCAKCDKETNERQKLKELLHVHKLLPSPSCPFPCTPEFNPEAKKAKFSQPTILQQQQQQLQQQQQQQLQQQLHIVGSNPMMRQHHPGMGGMMGNPPAVNPPQIGFQRQTIWRGVLEWNDKQSKDAAEALKSVPCAVTSNAKDGEAEVKVDNWPPKLVMQLLPKALISNIGGAYLKNSTSVLFHPSPCPALDALTKVMSSNFAGCVQFNNSNSPDCNLKVLILLYTPDKKVYLGFIPSDQTAFVERLRSLIQQRKNNPNLRKIPSCPQRSSSAGFCSSLRSDNVRAQPEHMGIGVRMMYVPDMNGSIGSPGKMMSCPFPALGYDFSKCAMLHDRLHNWQNLPYQHQDAKPIGPQLPRDLPEDRQDPICPPDDIKLDPDAVPETKPSGILLPDPLKFPQDTTDLHGDTMLVGYGSIFDSSVAGISSPPPPPPQENMSEIHQQLGLTFAEVKQEKLQSPQSQIEDDFELI